MVAARRGTWGAVFGASLWLVQGASASDPPADNQPSAAASTTVLASVAPSHHFDYSRFGDGPRSVPKPRGAAQRRALALGLGTVEVAEQLLHHRPEAAIVAAAGGPEPSELLWPVVNGHWGRGFGFTRRVRTDLRHNGLDIGALSGSSIRAAAAGIVAYSDNGVRGLGNCVIIVHPGGWTTLYAHNARNTVQAGWLVARGERIGLVGQTGIARGPHLHFEVRRGGRLVDPAALMTGYKDTSLTGMAAALGEEPAQDGSGEPPAPKAAIASASPAVPETVPVSTSRAWFLSRAPNAVEQSLVQGRTFRNLLWPVKQRTLRHPYGLGHHAVEMDAPTGSAVRAAADGVVLHAGPGLPGWGRAVVLLHRSGWVTMYGGNAEALVQVGDQVRRGDWIARVGDGGHGRASHLRFEWRVEGASQDPTPRLVQPARRRAR